MCPTLVDLFLIEVLERYSSRGHNEGVIPIDIYRFESEGYDWTLEFKTDVEDRAKDLDVVIQLEARFDKWHPDKYRYAFAYHVLEIE